jgi:hypothetical protein
MTEQQQPLAGGGEVKPPAKEQVKAKADRIMAAIKRHRLWKKVQQKKDELVEKSYNKAHTEPKGPVTETKESPS